MRYALGRLQRGDMPSEPPTRLSAELEYYESHKKEWLASNHGRYVVVKNGTVLGFFDTFEAAYTAAASKWGVDTDFLIRKVLEHEPVLVVY